MSDLKGHAAHWAVRANGCFLRIVHGEHKTTVADGIVSEAYASLIAAAPDLLAALENLADLCGEIFHKPAENQELQDALRVIAQATGASPHR